jgi:hypothetical protein
VVLLITHLVIPDQHAHYAHHNKRAEWLGKLINDIKPDVVINIGDAADMPSLSGYDKGKRGFHGRTYRKDIEAHLDFQDRLWSTVRRQKKRLPRTVFCVGNHEQRIEKALDLSPELVGSIGMEDLELDEWYDEVVPYVGGTPGTIKIDGIRYAHYFISGVMGRSIGGEHPAYSILTKQFSSGTCGHSHLFDFCVRTTGDGRKVMASHCGVYQDYDSDWAGECNKLWTRGVLVKRNVQNGCYDPNWISLDVLKKAYG